jgi:hypothetical protein
MDLSKYRVKDTLGTLEIQGKELHPIAEALAHQRLESITESVRPEFHDIGGNVYMICIKQTIDYDKLTKHSCFRP